MPTDSYCIKMMWLIELCGWNSKQYRLSSTYNYYFKRVFFLQLSLHSNPILETKSIHLKSTLCFSSYFFSYSDRNKYITLNLVVIGRKPLNWCIWVHNFSSYFLSFSGDKGPNARQDVIKHCKTLHYIIKS